jgi:hypothetical protein
VPLGYPGEGVPLGGLESRAVYQGQPRMKSGICLSLVDALELLSASDWNILVFRPKCRIGILVSKN